MNLLTKFRSEFEKRNVKVIAIASDSKRLLKKFKEENHIEIDIISDRKTKIIKDYNVYCFASGGAKSMKVKQAFPSKFLINKNREIVWTYIGKDKTDRPSIELMTKIIDEKL